MPTMKRSKSASAPIAPHQAVPAGIRAAAAASSIKGKRNPSGLARKDGTPKSTKACLDPLRSASLVTAATKRTKASSNRAMSNGETILVLLSGQVRLRGPCPSIPGPLKRIVATTSLLGSSLDWLWAGGPRVNADAVAAMLITKIADLGGVLDAVEVVRAGAAVMSIRVIADVASAALLASGAVAIIAKLPGLSRARPALAGRPSRAARASATRALAVNAIIRGSATGVATRAAVACVGGKVDTCPPAVSLPRWAPTRTGAFIEDFPPAAGVSTYAPPIT